MTNTSPNHQEWYLEVEGRRIGPFLGQQIADLFKDGEILSRHKVLSIDGATELSVEQFVQNRSNEEVEKPKLRPGEDPEIHLFNALQAARERKQPTHVEPQSSKFGYGLDRDSKQTGWIGALLGVICLLAVWGLVTVLRPAPLASPPANERISAIKTGSDAPTAPPASAPTHPTTLAPPRESRAGLAPTPPRYAPPPAPGGAVRMDRSRNGSADTIDHRRDAPRANEDQRDERDQREAENAPPAAAAPPAQEAAPPAATQDPGAPEGALPQAPVAAPTETTID